MRTTLSLLILVAGCNGGSSGTDGAVHDLAKLADLASPQDLAMAGGDMATATGDMAVGAMATLKLENYLSWCSVAVDNGAANTTALQTLMYPSGTVVHLSGDMASNIFVWGYWVGSDGDVSASHDQAMMTTVTMSGDKTVQACCPFATAPNTPCPPPT